MAGILGVLVSGGVSLPSNTLGFITLTQGSSGTAPNRFVGFSSGAPAFGSINPNTDPTNSKTITGFYWDQSAGQFNLIESGSPPNSGWNYVGIQDASGHRVEWARASATFTAGSTWTWAQSINPFASMASPCTIYWRN